MVPRRGALVSVGQTASQPSSTVVTNQKAEAHSLHLPGASVTSPYNFSTSVSLPRGVLLMMVCEICRKIESVDDDEAREIDEVVLGSLRDVSLTTCDFHPKLMGLEPELRRQEAASRVHSSRRMEFSSVVVYKWNDRLNISHYYSDSPDDNEKSGTSLRGPFVRYRSGDRIGMGMPLDDSWINIELLRKWIRSCDSHHEGSCRTHWLESNHHDVRPYLLVDASNKSLVDFTAQKYYALSYVWGETTSFLTTTTNLARLKAPGALMGNEVWSSLTETIRNAIQLVEVLDPPFLWVDALCVVQDDHLMRQKELEKMCFIFAHASATIIAGSGADANHGLRGLRAISPPRALPDRPIFAMPDGRKFVEPLFHWYGHMSLVGDRYSNRAWTFQEHLMSHRKIIFEKESVRWECEGADWYEDIDCEMEMGDKPSSAKEVRIFRAILQGKDTGQGQRTEEFVSEYNRRELRYPQDALFAYAGILTVLSMKDTGYISGMPALDFDVAMLWQPRGCIDRRVAIARHLDGDNYLTGCLPSWSWAGWACAIDHFCWHISSSEAVKLTFWPGFRGSYTVRLAPTVTWQYSTKLGGEKLQLDTLNTGQKRIHYIFCNTRRSAGTLNIGARLRHIIEEPGAYRRHPFLYEILHPSQQRIGVIEVSPSAKQGQYQDHMADHVELEPVLDGTSLDLVEISATEVLVKEPLEKNSETTTTTTLAEWMVMLDAIGSAGGSQKIYNVLWILWRDGYAERRALGWVDARAWDALDLANIDLALG